MDSRTETMLDMYLGGKTQNQIGKNFGLSRERVRQILSKHPGYHHGYNREYPAKIYKSVCRNCRKIILRTGYKASYCDKKCLYDFTDRKHRIYLKSGKKFCPKCKAMRGFYIGKHKNQRTARLTCKVCHAKAKRKWWKNLKKDPIRLKQYLEKQRIYHQTYYAKRRGVDK